MKYRYYITDLHSGAVVGTNSTEAEESLRHSEDHFVVDTETDKWLQSDGEMQIPEIE